MPAWRWGVWPDFQLSITCLHAAAILCFAGTRARQLFWHSGVPCVPVDADSTRFLHPSVAAWAVRELSALSAHAAAGEVSALS